MSLLWNVVASLAYFARHDLHKSQSIGAFMHSVHRTAVFCSNKPVMRFPTCLDCLMSSMLLTALASEVLSESETCC